MLHFELLASVRINVCSANFTSGNDTDICRCRALRLPLVMHKLQGVLVFLLHLAIVTWMPRHQIQGQDYGAVMWSCNAFQLLKEVDCNC